MKHNHFTTSQKEPTYRIRKGVAALGLAAAGVFTAACGSSEGAPATNNNIAAAENVQAGESSDLVYGEACKNQDNIYSHGRAVKPGVGVFESKEEFASKIIFRDGPKGSGSSVKVNFEDSQIDTLWDSYQADVADLIPGSSSHGSRVDIIAFGDDVEEDTSGYDGKLNKGLALCAFLTTEHGSYS